MKQEAIALVRFLPPGAAERDRELTREELREAGAGQWSGKVDTRDDVGCVLDRPAELPPEYDYVLPTTDEDPRAGERVTRLVFGKR